MCSALGLQLVREEFVRAKSLQWCSTLWNPVDCSPPGSSVHGILQAKILEWVGMPSSWGLNLHLLHLRHCQGGSLLPQCHLGSPKAKLNYTQRKTGQILRTGGQGGAGICEPWVPVAVWVHKCERCFAWVGVGGHWRMTAPEWDGTPFWVFWGRGEEERKRHKA